MRASNLSSLYLTLGQVQKAVGMARRSVDFADRSGDFHAQCFGFGALGASFHQSGKLQESENSFQELESIQKEKQPGSRYLYSFQGFLFCDLLLSRGRVQEVLERAGCALDYSKEPWYSMHSCALDNLSLGRAHLLQTITAGSPDYSKSEGYLNQAVTGLREAGYQDDLARGLLARATLYRVQENFAAAWEDLSEAQEIAERGEMGLHLADFHLEACRLHLAQHKAGESFVPESLWAKTISPVPKNHLEAAKAHLKIAKEKINKMGYHRRDPELDDLRSQIANYK